MGRSSFLLSVGLVIAILTGVYTGFLFWRNNSLEQDIKQLDSELTVSRAQLQGFEGDNVEASIAAKEKLNLLEQEAVVWSEVIEKIIDTVPFDAGKPVVDILSYSGSGDDDLSLSLRTLGGSRKPYENVAALIAAFDDNDSFVDSFVPSIATSINEDGDEILSFNFSTQYLSELAAEEEVKVEVPSSLGAPVPREPAATEKDDGESLEDALGDVIDDALKPSTDDADESSVAEDLVDSLDEDFSDTAESADEEADVVIR